MKLGKTLFAVILGCALVSPALAADKKDAAKAAGDKPAAAANDKPKSDKPKAAKGIKGSVVKVDGDKLVIKAGKAADAKEVTITTDANTKVTIDGKEGKLADLKEGQVVAVTPAEGTAQTITVATAAAKPKKDGDKAAAKTEKAAK